VEIPVLIRETIEEQQLRIEISRPRIKEQNTHHYYEFDLDNYEKKKLKYHKSRRSFEVKVPSSEELAAVKLGLPQDYKNNFRFRGSSQDF